MEVLAREFALLPFTQQPQILANEGKKSLFGKIFEKEKKYW